MTAGAQEGPARPGRLDTPQSIPAEFVAAWAARDPDRLAAIFDADAEFVNVTGLWWHDRAAIRKAHAYGLSRIFDRSTLTITAMRVKLLTDAVAVVHARMKLTGQSAAVGIDIPGTRQTIFSFVVHRTPDGWRCASAQNTDIVPRMETHIVDEAGQITPVRY